MAIRLGWAIGALVISGSGAIAAPAEDRVAASPRTLGRASPHEAFAIEMRSNSLAVPAGSDAIDRRLGLKIVYTDAKIYNPSTQTYDHVRLRSYNGTDVSPDAPYVAPTIEVSPGDTVRMELDNQLPLDPSCSSAGMTMNVPHCFNGTNLHAHGLWVSPTGNSDNVLLSIDPGMQFEYEYNIPRDHPAGTFWYHTHRHGSTALQVSSGMAGALIVRGNRTPSANTHGDLETLLYQGGTPIPEQVVVFQQIQYGCLDKNGHIKVKTAKAPDGSEEVVAWVCDPGDIGGIETYDDGGEFHSGFGPGSWEASGRYTSINGQVLATLQSTAGRLARWRLIHAGVRDTIALQFQRMTPAGVKALNGLAAKDGAAFKAAYCVGDPVPFYVVANDGLTTSSALRRTQVTLQPGYRNDILLVFPTAGDYCMINGAVSAGGSVSAAPKATSVLGKVTVAKGQDVPDIAAFVTDQLVTSAKARMPPGVRQAVIDDLRAGLKLTRFTAHAPITDGEVAAMPVEKVLFNIDVSTQPIKFEVGSQDYAPRSYQPERIDRTLTLGRAQEWRLQSEFVSHPFHIHVNPFQIVAILDPDGKDVSAEGAVDDYAGGAPDPNYPGLKGQWKDTLWVKSAKLPNMPVGIYTAIVRTRYQRYIGEYVLHCHILDHEDQGMMQNIRIALPSEAPMGMNHH